MKNKNPKVECFCDGACKPNPGLATWAYVITNPWIENFGTIEGESTNNVAEYFSLIKLLEELEILKIENAIIHTDSKLVVETVNGNWECKKYHIKELCEESQSLMKNHILLWIPRESNEMADSLTQQFYD